MYFLKRARLYVTRKWGKTITVGIILFVVSVLVLTGLLIKTASQSTFDMARNKLGATVSYATDLSSIMGNNGGGRPTERGTGTGFTLPDDYTTITTKEVELIAANSKYVDNYTISATIAGNAVDFNYYNPSSSDTTEEDSNTPGFDSFIKNSANINIVGVDIKSKESNFNTDDNTIVEGRYFTNDEVDNSSKVVMIEKTIADLNEIKVGDSITIERVNQRGRMTSSSTSTDESTATVNITYQVIGIYKTSNPTDLANSSFMGSFNLTENTMYAPYTTVLSASLEGLNETDLATSKANIEQNGYEVQSVIFNLNNPEDINAFITEVKAMKDINITYRSLNANDAAYEQMVGPIENVANTSTVLVVVVIIAGAFIIGLLSMLSIKDRKYELGVLLSLGESRLKIVSQLVSEMLIVSIISFGLATIASNFTAQATTNFLLNQEIASSATDDTTSNDRGFGGMGMIRIDRNQLSKIDVETIDTLTISVNSNDILKMFGLGILIIVMGNIIQAMFVLRCNPKQILLER